MSRNDGPGRREVAHRLLATEFDAASLEYADSDEERAPKYVITPTGARANRLFVVGVLTEIERVSDDVIRARIVDPTGAFVVYAGQYQPDATAFIERAEPPAFVAVTGKANTFQPDDSDRVFTSVRPESIGDVDPDTRDRWTVQAAEHTLARIDAFAAALSVAGSDDDPHDRLVESGFEDPRAQGIALARDHYGTTPAYLGALRETALQSARLVAGELDEVEMPSLAPGDGGEPVSLDELRLSEDARETIDAAAGTTESETTTHGEATASDAATADEPEATDGLDDFEATPDTEGTVESDEASETDDLDEAGIYEMSEEERAAVEDEHDVAFSTADEVSDPGETDIDVPDADDFAELEAESEGVAADETDVEEADIDTEATTPDEGGEPTAEDADAEIDGSASVEDAAMETMRDLADDDGADRAEVVELVAEEHGVDPDRVEDAIESALMSGRCYEPQDGVLKPI